MEEIILDIVAALKQGRPFGHSELVRLLHAYNKPLGLSKQFYTKKKLLPYYLTTKQNDPVRWESWEIDETTERALLQLLRIKPRRTSSGVATITVITKPHPCSGACIYCPNDIRMPKSYLSNEPACQRAERNFFDPYLQVSSRLKALYEMGHATDKIELIVLGGTWSDYPLAYRIWYMTELFRALNDAGTNDAAVAQRRALYEHVGISADEAVLAAQCASAQAHIDALEWSYGQAYAEVYAHNKAWCKLAEQQTATWDELEQAQAENVMAEKRAVGLVVETRPDAITPQELYSMRRMGCTKVQMGIQSLQEQVITANARGTSREVIARALALTRLFGFKLHTHFMVNLLGATPESDKADYLEFVSDERFLPDEVKLYPCVLVGGTGLCTYYEAGTWAAYSDDELLDILVADMQVTPVYTRISRMIRDISTDDIIAGNKRPNLRQLAELKASQAGAPVQEMRSREICEKSTASSELEMQDYCYNTSVSTEHFLQWVTSAGELAGFLRLSLPKQEVVAACGAHIPYGLSEAMIREVHVYGKVAQLSGRAQNAQHLGLGKALVERACELAREAGFERINVISSVGTREYYRKLGFDTVGLYQQRALL